MVYTKIFYICRMRKNLHRKQCGAVFIEGTFTPDECECVLKAIEFFNPVDVGFPPLDGSKTTEKEAILYHFHEYVTSNEVNSIPEGSTAISKRDFFESLSKLDFEGKEDYFGN